jgi:hypothetical protein
MAVNPQIKTLDLRPPKAPNLPIAPIEYRQLYQDQVLNALRLYFNQIDNFATGIGGTNGGGLLQFPYGAFSSDQDQTATANTATLMTLNTTDFANGVSIASSKITVENPGIYNLQFSTQFANTNSNVQDVFIWLRQGSGAGAATDITGSTGFVSIPGSHGGTDGHSIVGWNYFLSMAADDYVQIYWSVPNTAVSIQHLAASGSPTKPSTQSVVATLSFVSRLPTNT